MREVSYRIMQRCIGCKTCCRACPYEAIQTGPVRIDQEKCMKCGICHQKCPLHAVLKIER